MEPPDEREQAARLWDMAYASLRDEFTNFFNVYEANIMEFLARRKGLLSFQMEGLSEMDALVRRSYMTEALEVWLKDTGEAGADGDPEAATAQAHSLRNTLGVLVRRQPHTSLGWLAACLAIDVCRSIYGNLPLHH